MADLRFGTGGSYVCTGVLSGYKTKRGHWRLSIESVQNHFGIVINEPIKVKVPSNETRLIITMTIIKKS